MMTTITREQFEAAWNKFRDTDQVPKAAFGIVLKDLGITIAEPDPPAAMVKLAREIVVASYGPHVFGSGEGPTRVRDIRDGKGNTYWEMRAVIAALQHADLVVRKWMPADCLRDNIRRQLGAIA